MTDTLTRAPLDPAVVLAQVVHEVLTGSCESDPHPLLVRLVVHSCADETLTEPQVDAAWAEYVAAVNDELAIEDGQIPWYEIDPDLTCDDRTEVARDIARNRSAEALAVLTGQPS